MKDPNLKKPLWVVGFLCLTSLITAQSIFYPKQTCLGNSSGCVNGEVPNSFDFSIQNLGGTISEFSFFWDFGDGEFSNVHDPKHTFKKAGTFNVKVQYTRIAGTGYDDDPPPKTVVIDNPIVLTTGDISSLKLPDIPDMYYSGVMDLFESQKPVTRETESGDTVTYVIRVRSQCLEKGPDREGTSVLGNLYFEYNPGVFEVLDPSVDTDEYTSGNTSISNPTQTNSGTGLSLVKVLHWDLSVLDPRDSMSIFIHLHVKSGLSIGDEVKIESYITDLNDDPLSSEVCDGSTSVEATEDIAFSHDPNIDVVSQELICPGFIPDKLDYTIHFQNTGVDTAERVEVTVWFDEYMDVNKLVLANAKVGPHAIGANLINIQKGVGYATWTFENTRLRGTADPRLLDSQIDSTKGYIKFSLGFDHDPDPCSAIFNQASIVFDCNPPVFTTPSIVRVGCDEGPNCTDCNEMILRAQGSVPANFSSLSFESVHRFPSDPDDKAPGYVLLGRKLVGPYNCFRAIAMVGIPDCNLEVEDQSVMAPNCNGASRIKLHVRNGQAPFRWQDCTFTGTGAMYERANVSPGTYTIAVTDNDGCVGEATVTVPGPDDIQFFFEFITAREGQISVVGSQGATTIEVKEEVSPLNFVTYSTKTITDWTDNIVTVPGNTNTLKIIVRDAYGCPSSQLVYR
ncbi:MAG: PKD domain-containing protein [Saprospiraceae bacterium]|nr:PKD domain-containing protein [Saprospiraceae bacterium]